MTGRPQYLDIPYESPARIGPNGVPVPPLAGGPAAPPPPDAPPAPAPRETEAFPYKASPTLPFKMVEEKPVAPETTEALLQAIHKVFRVATARIKYHEAEAAKLRAALAPFSGLASPAGGAPASSPSSDAITSLLEAVRLLPELESGHAETSQS